MEMETKSARRGFWNWEFIIGVGRVCRHWPNKEVYGYEDLMDKGGIDWCCLSIF